jgi:uncharacterized protein YkwD
MSLANKVIVVFALGICVSLAVPVAGSPAPTQAEASILRTINQVRAQHGLAPLRVDVRLERAARAYSAHMMRTGTFAHGNFGARIRSYGARGPVVGENLAWGVGGAASSQAVVQMWMNSPPHRANLLRPGFRRIGVGRRVGTFAGHGGAAVVTANFAGR